jgi:hypothetical protein
VVNVTWTNSFLLPFILCFNQFWIAARLVGCFCESTAGSLPVSSTVILPSEVAVVDSGVVGRSAVYSRYNDGPRTLPWCAHID